MATPSPGTDDATAAAPASAEDQSSSLFTGDLDEAALAEQAAAMEAALASMEETLETNEMDRQEEASYFTVAAKITTDADEDGDDDDDADEDVVNIESIAMKAFATMMTTNMFDEEEEEFRNQVSEDLAQRKEAQQKEQQEREKQQLNSGSSNNNHGRNKVVLEVTDDERDEQSAADSEDEDEAANDNMSIDDSVGSEEEEEDPSLDASSSSSASGATSASGKSAATSASESSAATSASEKSAATSASEKSDAASAGSASDDEDGARKSLRAATTNTSNNLHASFNSSSLHRSKGSLQSSSRSLSIFEIQDPDLETDNNDSDEVLLKHGILRVDESSTDQAFICDWDRWRKWKKRKRENDTSSNSNRMEDSSQRWGDDSSVRQSDSNLRMPRRRTSESTHTSASEANLYETDNLTIESTTTTGGGEDGGGPCFDWKAWRRRQLSSTSRTSVSSSLGGDDFDEGSVLQKLNEWEVLEESMRSLTSVDDDEYADEVDISLEHTDLRRSSDPGKKIASLNRANSEVFSTKRTSMPARANSDKNLKKHRASSDRNLLKKHQSPRRSTSPRRKQAKSPVGDSWKKWQRDKRRSGITKRSYSERNISLSGDSDDDTFDGDDHHEDDEPSQQRIQLTKSQSEKWKEGADNDKKSKRRGRFQRAQSERFNLNDKAPAIPGKKGFRRAQSWDSCKLANAEQVFDWKTWRKDKRKTMKKSSSDRPFRKQKSDKSLSKSLHG